MGEIVRLNEGEAFILDVPLLQNVRKVHANKIRDLIIKQRRINVHDRIVATVLKKSWVQVLGHQRASTTEAGKTAPSQAPQHLSDQRDVHRAPLRCPQLPPPVRLRRWIFGGGRHPSSRQGGGGFKLSSWT